MWHYFLCHAKEEQPNHGWVHSLLPSAFLFSHSWFLIPKWIDIEVYWEWVSEEEKVLSAVSATFTKAAVAVWLARQETVLPGRYAHWRHWQLEKRLAFVLLLLVMRVQRRLNWIESKLFASLGGCCSDHQTLLRSIFSLLPRECNLFAIDAQKMQWQPFGRHSFTVSLPRAPKTNELPLCPWTDSNGSRPLLGIYLRTFIDLILHWPANERPKRGFRLIFQYNDKLVMLVCPCLFSLSLFWGYSFCRQAAMHFKVILNGPKWVATQWTNLPFAWKEPEALVCTEAVWAVKLHPQPGTSLRRCSAETLA